MGSFFNTASRESTTTTSSRISILGWLLFWFAIALTIRLTQLTTKAPWTDEVATTLFSLGNYSRLIPLNQIVDIDTILRPLQITPGTTAADVIRHLFIEDNHPPVYFVLAHWWMQAFHGILGSADGYASLWAERALSALIGALAVPAAYVLGWLSSRDKVISLLSAALVAVSPFSVFLSQEARHYTLAFLVVIASLCCFVHVAQKVKNRQPAHWGVVLAWVGLNTLGLAVHYFFGLTTASEGLVMGWMLIQQSRQQSGAPKKQGALWRQAHWVRVYVAALGSLMGALVWLPLLLNFYGSPQTSFLQSASIKSWSYWIGPIGQSLAGWYYTLFSPITNGYSWQAITIIVISCVLLLGMYGPWLTVQLWFGLRFQQKKEQSRTGIQTLVLFFIAANALFFLICYGSGFDITRGHRYTFVFSPSILVLVAFALSPFWNMERAVGSQKSRQFERVKLLPNISLSGRNLVALVLCVAFLGTQFVVFERTNLKFYKAERLINHIQANSTLPVVIGDSARISQQPAVIGMRIMAVGWEIQRNFAPDVVGNGWIAPPAFILVENNAQKEKSAEAFMREAIALRSEAFDLWLIGGSGGALSGDGSAVDLSAENCGVAVDGRGNRGSFGFTHYVCQGSREQ
ncbi:MAG: phospholipid carrier-dependent glycosyltransferase [Cyanobacteria bacterium J06627_28]